MFAQVLRKTAEPAYIKLALVVMMSHLLSTKAVMTKESAASLPHISVHAAANDQESL